MDNQSKQGNHAVSQHVSQQGRYAGKFEERLGRIFLACGVQKDADLARVLGIKPQSIAAARKRQQIPTGWIEQVAEKYHILADWLFFGIGPMRRGEVAAPAPTTADQAPPAPAEDFKMSDMLTKTAEVLESETIYRTALASNINAFHQAVQGERLMARMDQRLADLEAKSETMSKEINELRKENRELKQRLEPTGQEKAVG